MAFELLQKGIKGFALPDKTVRISKRSISFSKDLKGLFGKRYGLEVYIDKKEEKIGFLSSEDTFKAYKLNRYRCLPKINLLFKTFPDAVNKNYKVTIEEKDMVVVDLKNTR